MFEDQIQNLLENVKPPNTPFEIDLVLEGGGFNGSYELGILLFLRELERKGYIQFNRFSGASIGAILAVAFLANDLDDYIEMYSSMRESWRETMNFKVIQERIRTLCDRITPELFETLKEDTLYITYYNFDTQKQIIQSSYESVDDIYYSLLKTCYLPYLMDNTLTYFHENQYFIDGGQPFIFHNREKSLYKKIMYISINQIHQMYKSLSIKHEQNPYGRILAGLLDCYEFFKDGCMKPTIYCSFVNDWTMVDYISLRIKNILCVVMVYGLFLFSKMKDTVLPYVENLKLYKMLTPIFNNMYKDIILTSCF